MKTLVIAEHNNQQLKTASLNTLSAAMQLGAEIDVLVIGCECQSVAKQASQLTGVAQVILSDAPAYKNFLAENIAAAVAELASEYRYVIAPASTFGKNFMPRVAALLDVTQYSDITAVIAPDTFSRPIYAGNAIMTVQALDPIICLTVRSTAFETAVIDEKTAAPIISYNKVVDLGVTEYQETIVTAEKSRPELTNARVVVSGGRGLQNAENFRLIEQLADCLHAAIGASRAAVDAGFVPNDYQVGQTGKVVAPDLYIAVGISGAIQHIAGMKDSKVIVAINKDPDAPIFQVADYGVVGDLFEVIPALISALSHK